LWDESGSGSFLLRISRLQRFATARRHSADWHGRPIDARNPAPSPIGRLSESFSGGPVAEAAASRMARLQAAAKSSAAALGIAAPGSCALPPSPSPPPPPFLRAMRWQASHRPSTLATSMAGSSCGARAAS